MTGAALIGNSSRDIHGNRSLARWVERFGKEFACACLHMQFLETASTEHDFNGRQFWERQSRSTVVHVTFLLWTEPQLLERALFGIGGLYTTDDEAEVG